MLAYSALIEGFHPLIPFVGCRGIRRQRGERKAKAFPCSAALRDHLTASE